MNLARYEKLDAEDLLNRTIHKFVRRFQQIERAVHKTGRRLEDCSLEELDALWEAAKHKSVFADRRGDRPPKNQRNRHHRQKRNRRD